MKRLDITDETMLDLWIELDVHMTLTEFSEEYWKIRDADGHYLIDADPFGYRTPTLMGRRLVFAGEGT